MENLSVQQLHEAYDKAVKQNLNKNFIRLLEKEIKHRGLSYSIFIEPGSK